MGGRDRKRFLLIGGGIQQMKNKRHFELFFVFSMLFLTNLSVFLSSIWLRSPVVLFTLVMWLIFAVICFWFLYLRNHIPLFLKSLRENWFILPFLVFSAFSIFWSVAWQISFSRWLIFAITILAGGYMGLRYNLKELIRIFSGFGLLMLVLCGVFVIWMPDVGVMNYENIQGAWKGLYWHKNHMGLVATFINLLFLIEFIMAFRSREEHPLYWFLLYLFSLLFIFQSDSVAAYLTTMLLHGLVALGLVWIKFRDKVHSVHLIVFVIFLFLALIFLFANLDQVFGVFNRNTTLTGRIPMWTNLYNLYFSQRPVLGYGFNAFWYSAAHRETMAQTTGYPDPIVIADNGFIDILINTGYIGFVLFLVFYLGLWWRSGQNVSNAKDIIGLFPMILMSYTFIANISWSLIFENESFFMLAMVSVLFCNYKNYLFLKKDNL
jgi:exopolysaccharide production protein ExoQ